MFALNTNFKKIYINSEFDTHVYILKFQLMYKNLRDTEQKITKYNKKPNTIL